MNDVQVTSTGTSATTTPAVTLVGVTGDNGPYFTGVFAVDCPDRIPVGGFAEGEVWDGKYTWRVFAMRTG